MFELFKSVAAAFGGRLSEAPEARKLVWLMLVTLFFGGCCVFFVAYVSYSRYRAVAGFLPGADGVAICFTVGIALFMYYASSHVSAFAIELWLRGVSRLAWQGAVLIAIAGLLVGVIDYRMNVDGAQDVALASVGETAAVDEAALVKPFAESIAALESRIAEVKQKYYWKGKLYFEPYPVTRHSLATWSLDTAKVNQLDRQIAVQEELKAAALGDARERYAGEKSRRSELRDTTHARLRVAVRGVYFLQFLLTLVLAFILLQMDDALRGSDGRTAGVKPGKQNIGFGTAAVPSSADRNRIERLQHEIEMLKNSQNGNRVPENTVAVQKETAAVMDETVGVMQDPESETLTVYHHSKGFKIICENCGKEAVKKSPQARFCSKRCRIRSWNGRHVDRRFPEG
jgi:hypothetical protein